METKFGRDPQSWNLPSKPQTLNKFTEKGQRSQQSAHEEFQITKLCARKALLVKPLAPALGIWPIVSLEQPRMSPDPATGHSMAVIVPAGRQSEKNLMSDMRKEGRQVHFSIFSLIAYEDWHLYSTTVQPDAYTLSISQSSPPVVFKDSRYRHVFGTAITDPILMKNSD